jgi:hypothetical protein
MKNEVSEQNLVIARGSSAPSTAKDVIAAYAARFAGLATLFCCALPALLVLVGFGLTGVLTFFTAIPGWQNFGAYDIWLFPLAGILLALGFYLAYRHRSVAQGEACEVPPGGREAACSTANRWNRRILWLSVSLYGIALVMNLWGIGWMRAHGFFSH